jgi:hypothetical protein
LLLSQIDIFSQNDSSKKNARTINGFATVNSPINLHCEIKDAIQILEIQI